MILVVWRHELGKIQETLLHLMSNTVMRVEKYPHALEIGLCYMTVSLV